MVYKMYRLNAGKGYHLLRLDGFRAFRLHYEAPSKFDLAVAGEPDRSGLAPIDAAAAAALERCDAAVIAMDVCAIVAGAADGGAAGTGGGAEILGDRKPTRITLQKLSLLLSLS